jgi:hypothetical protein
MKLQLHCSVKLYDILRVKNALVKSVYCIREYNSYSLVIYPSGISHACLQNLKVF